MNLKHMERHRTPIDSHGGSWSLPPYCVCCLSTEQLEWDHIIPRAQGGLDRKDNYQILCRRCNLSKFSGLSCRIDHRLDVMMPNSQKLQNDPSTADGKIGGTKRSIKNAISPGPNPQVNWRVEESLKQEIEETAKRRGISAGEIIKELWRGQHAEIIAMLREILLSVHSLHAPAPSTVEASVPDVTALISRRSPDHPLDPPTPGEQAQKLSWWRRR